LEECRRLIGNDAISDAELEALRDRLYQLAQAAIARYASIGNHDKFARGLSMIPEADQADIEERAAILEFDGRLSRDQAERLALSHYRLNPARA